VYEEQCASYEKNMDKRDEKSGMRREEYERTRSPEDVEEDRKYDQEQLNHYRNSPPDYRNIAACIPDS
jgi:hypothetical protein